MINSYKKGYVFEHEIEKDLSGEFGDARLKRVGTQESFKGTSGDIVAFSPEHILAEFHLELNHAQNPQVFKKFDKAAKDAKAFKKPVLIVKKTGDRTLVVMDYAAWKALIYELAGYRAEQKVSEDFLKTKLK